MKCWGIKGSLRRVSDFSCADCLEKLHPIDGRQVKEVLVEDEKVEAVPEFCYLGDMLSAGGGCELAAFTHCKSAKGKFRQQLPLHTNHNPPEVKCTQLMLFWFTLIKVIPITSFMLHGFVTTRI